MCELVVVNYLEVHDLYAYLLSGQIMVVRNVERDDVEFICRVCGWGL